MQKNLQNPQKNTASRTDITEKAENETQNTVQEDGVKYSIKYPSFSSIEIKNNTVELAQMESVFNVHEDKLKRTGLQPSEIFEKYFESLNNNIYSEVFGDIALRKSSVKSEIRHGITAEKIASIEAIPNVIEKGKVIFFETKNNSDVQRIVVAAPIKIGSEPYYMGVMLQRDSQNQRLYLHNVVIEKEMSTNSQANLLTTGALEDDEHLYITTILQKALVVKNNSMQNGSDDTQNRKSIKLSSSAEKLLKSSPELQMVIKDLQQQTKLSHGYVPEAKRIHSYAYELKKTCESTLNVAEIEKDLRDIYEVLASMNGSEGYQYATELFRLIIWHF